MLPVTARAGRGRRTSVAIVCPLAGSSESGLPLPAYLASNGRLPSVRKGAEPLALPLPGMSGSAGPSAEAPLDRPAAVVVLHPRAGAANGQAADVCSGLSDAGFEAEALSASPADLLAVLGELSSRRGQVAVVNLCGRVELGLAPPLVAGLLGFHGLRFAGNTAETLTCALDRRITKAILYAAGIPTPGARVFRRRPTVDAVRDMSFPLVVKTLRTDPAVPVSLLSYVTTPDELCRRVEEILDGYGRPALAELYLDGREFGVAVTGEGKDARAISLEEYVFPNSDPSAPRLATEGAAVERRCPAEVGEHLRVAIATAAVAAYRALECRDCAWVAVRLGRRDEPHVLEIDAAPGLWRASPFSGAVAASGDAYEDFLARLVARVWSR